MRNRIVDNFAIDATGGGLWDDTTHYKVTVPAGKRWIFYGGIVNRSVSSTLLIKIRNAAAKAIYDLMNESAASQIDSYPAPAKMGVPIPMQAGDYVIMTFGTAQDASAYASCVVEEFSV